VTTSADRFRSRAIDGWLPSDEEYGPGADASAADVLSALRLPTKGTIYDLDVGRWSNMPLFPSEPPFRVLQYRSPAGLRIDDAFRFWTGGGYHVGWNGDFFLGGGHCGTHVDALSHITEGEDAHWYRGFNEHEHLSDFGPTRCDGAAIPPFICRGVLVDVAGLKEVEVLPGGYQISEQDVRDGLERQGTEIRQGDAVFVRTGYIKYFDGPEQETYFGSGVGIEASTWLAERGAILVGADNEGVEQLVLEDPTDSKPLPVHVDLLIERGIYMLEMANLEELSHDGVYEFLFVCSAPRTRGTTGAYARPLAIV
jgi:kynurenine formamidase